MYTTQLHIGQQQKLCTRVGLITQGNLFIYLQLYIDTHTTLDGAVIGVWYLDDFKRIIAGSNISLNYYPHPINLEFDNI